jgi:putative amino-acid transport system substrate-binding protein
MIKKRKWSKLFFKATLFAAALVSVVSLASPAFAATKTLRVGTTGESFPTSFKKNDKLVGFDVEITKLVAKKLGYKVKFVTSDFSGLMGQLDSGKVDTLAQNFAVTADRKKKFTYSVPYNHYATSVAVLKSSNYKTLKSLEGKTVGAVVASENTTALKKYDSKIDIKTYDTRDEMYQALSSGHVEGVVNTIPVLKATINQKKLPWRVVKGQASDTQVAFPFKKDAHGKKLQKQFNKELKVLKKDGQIKKLAVKYFGYDTTKGEK